MCAHHSSPLVEAQSYRRGDWHIGRLEALPRVGVAGGQPGREDPPIRGVRATALDDSFEARPSVHIYVRSVAAWETLPDDGLDRFETTSG